MVAGAGKALPFLILNLCSATARVVRAAGVRKGIASNPLGQGEGGTRCLSEDTKGCLDLWKHDISAVLTMF